MTNNKPHPTDSIKFQFQVPSSSQTQEIKTLIKFAENVMVDSIDSSVVT